MIELSSDEDDALQISSESDDERSGTPAPDESSGAHANDAHNQPDPQGNVLVNMNHPPEEADLYLAPQLARAVKPHQVTTTRPHSMVVAELIMAKHWGALISLTGSCSWY